MEIFTGLAQAKKNLLAGSGNEPKQSYWISSVPRVSTSQKEISCEVSFVLNLDSVNLHRRLRLRPCRIKILSLVLDIYSIHENSDTGWLQPISYTIFV
jgi:hypothetical protein